MADEKLSQLAAISDPIVGSDLFYIVRGGVSYQGTIDQLLAIVGGTVEWGDIDGTLSDQADLASALAAKASAATLSSHIANTSNPHSVTKAQVGLSSVDNTADTAKPVSTAQAAADAAVLSTAEGYTDSLASATATALALKAPLASPTFTGTPAAPTPAADTNTTQLASTAFVVGQAGASNPVMNGSVAVGTSKKYSREDHVHASDTSRAPVASPTFTGTPAAPTPSAADNTTKLATTAFVQAAITAGIGDAYAIQYTCSDVTTDITAGTNKAIARVPYASTLTEVRGSVSTAPLGANILIDVNKNGTTVLSTKLQIDNNSKTSVASGTQPVISAPTFASDDEVEFDFDQVGSSTPGKQVVVTLYFVRTA